MWVFSWINLLHLMTQVKWVASDMRIWRSLVAPFSFTIIWCGCCCPFWPSCLFAIRFLQPRMVPRDISGHQYSLLFQASLVSFQIVVVTSWVHRARMCSMDLVILHFFQVPHVVWYSEPCFPNHGSIVYHFKEGLLDSHLYGSFP